MPDVSEFGAYDSAYIVGGPQRVAMVAFVALLQDEQVKLSHALHRVRVVRQAPRDDVEAAMLEAIPSAGRLLGSLLAVAAASDAVAQIGAVLHEQRVLARAPWKLGTKIRAYGMRRRLRSSPRDGLNRVAVLGSAGIADAALRKALETPDPVFVLPKIKTPPTRLQNEPYKHSELSEPSIVDLPNHGW